MEMVNQILLYLLDKHTAQQRVGTKDNQTLVEYTTLIMVYIIKNSFPKYEPINLLPLLNGISFSLW